MFFFFLLWECSLTFFAIQRGLHFLLLQVLINFVQGHFINLKNPFAYYFFFFNLFILFFIKKKILKSIMNDNIYFQK